MTRWNIDDLAGRLEEESKNGVGIPWKIINLPALCEDPDNDPLGRKMGESLWPEYYTKEALNILKGELSSKIWTSLYQGNPIDEIGGAVQRGWFMRYEQLPKIEDRKRITVSVDTAAKDNQRADYSVVSVWIETNDGQHYLAFVFRKKMEFNEMERNINSISERWGASNILVEDKGSGTQYIQRQTDPKTKTAPCLVTAIPVDKNKEFRFDGVTPLIEAGLVYLPANRKTPWLADYENELIAFPTGKNDDQVDATSQYLKWAKPKRKLGTKKLVGFSKDRDKAKAEIQAHMDMLQEKIRQTPNRQGIRMAKIA